MKKVMKNRNFHVISAVIIFCLLASMSLLWNNSVPESKHANSEGHDFVENRRTLADDTEKKGVQWSFKIISALPVKDSSSVTSRSSSYIPADRIVDIVESTAKKATNFEDLIIRWTDAIFVEADCYIPLCSDDFELLNWITDPDTVEQDNVYTTSSDPDFEICCTLADTEADPNDPDQANCILNSLQSCRVQQMDPPCDEVVDFAQDPSPPDTTVCVRDDATMQLSLIFETTQNEESCCQSCACYGDPRCVSFNKTTDIWVLCDARTEKNIKRDNLRCEIKEEQCLVELDHDNNPCHWIDLTQSEEDAWSIIVNGSRCVPNLQSSESWITMYKFDGFEYRIRQHERGVINKVSITFGDEQFNLTADDCYNGDFNNSWSFRQLSGPDTRSPTVSPVPGGSPTFPDVVLGFVSENGYDYIIPPPNFVLKYEELADEYVWLVTDETTRVHSKIRCLRQIDTLGRRGPPRINVESLIEPENDFAGRENLGGFCYTSSFPKTGTTANTDKIETGDGCDVNGSNDEAVAVARLICGEYIIFSSIPSCVVSFCEQHSFPNYGDYTDCVSDIGDGTDGYDFKTGFCKALTYSDDDYDLCIGKWENDGVEIAVQMFLNSERNDESPCANSVEDLPTNLNECEAGVELQYLNDEFEWVTYVSFPENYPPCSILEFDFTQHEELFVNPIRLKQCNIPNFCYTDGAFCQPQTGFAAELVLSTGPLGNEVSGFPTTHPTTRPTNSPTESPLVVQTENPTRFPTSRPTKEPTTFPTLFPTKKPTSFPTLFPTRHSKSPTSSPIQSQVVVPTANPTRSPVKQAGWSSGTPSKYPTSHPLAKQTLPPSISPTQNPTNTPTENPSLSPTESPSVLPTWSPSIFPTSSPTWSPSASPTTAPTDSPTQSPSETPTESPTKTPTWSPTESPTTSPTRSPTNSPTKSPTLSPSESPTLSPTSSPTLQPTTSPTSSPTTSPTLTPTSSPTSSPTKSPTLSPSMSPTTHPSWSPSETPTRSPTKFPTDSPTESPTRKPTESPSESPTYSPTIMPTESPTVLPTWSPSKFPTRWPTKSPTHFPTRFPTRSPSDSPTGFPTLSPLTEFIPFSPTASPTKSPSKPNVWGRILKESTQKQSVTPRSVTPVNEGDVAYGNLGEIGNSKKMSMKEAGRVMFTSVYGSETEARKQLAEADISGVLRTVNSVLAVNIESSYQRLLSTAEEDGFEFGSTPVLAVVCEMKLVDTADLIIQTSSPTSSRSSPAKSGSFFSNSSWPSIVVAVVAALVIIALTLLVITALRRRSRQQSMSSYDEFDL